MERLAATDAIILDIIIEYLSANANVSPVIRPVSDTNASCIPSTIAPVYSNRHLLVIRTIVSQYMRNDARNGIYVDNSNTWSNIFYI